MMDSYILYMCVCVLERGSVLCLHGRNESLEWGQFVVVGGFKVAEQVKRMDLKCINNWMAWDYLISQPV